MRQKGFEPPTHGLEGRCSIRLSYWRAVFFAGTVYRASRKKARGRAVRSPAPERTVQAFSSDTPAPSRGSQTGQAGGEEEQGGGFGDWIDIVRVSFEGQC